jgi:glutamate racemase
MKLGIFDSGIGGEAVASALRTTFPRATIVTANDHDNVPYGNKTPEQVITLTDVAIQPLLESSCDVIILACNTATAIAIATLRKQYPQQKFIGIEPMIKNAAKLTKTGIIAVCATPATLASSRYQGLLASYAKDLVVVAPNCSNWAYMIENDQVNHRQIDRVVNEICEQGADIIVLGCTHYHWIKDLIISSTTNRAVVLEPSEAIGRRVKELLGLNHF